MSHKYFAFISYQRKDEEWARWLHHQLEHYHLPIQLIENNPDLPHELRPLFLDEAELSGGSLSEKIHSALVNSKYLIVLCSTDSAKSTWVNAEVQTFIDLQRTNRIIPLIINGIPYSDDANECFTPALKKLRGTENERYAINAKYGREMASVKVVAELLGVQFDILWSRYEREKEEERQRLKAYNDRLLAFQSRAWSQMATRLIGEGDTLLAQKLALEALPQNFDNPERPLVAEAEVALRRAIEAEQCNSCYAILPHKFEIESMTVSPNGNTLASISGGDIYTWDLNTGALLWKIQHTAYHDILFGPDGKLYVKELDGVYVINSTIGLHKEKFKEVFNDFRVKQFLFRPGTHTMYIVSEQGDVATWDADLQCEIGKRRVLYTYTRDMTFTPDGRHIAFLSESDTRNEWCIVIKNADTLEETIDILPIKGDHVFSLCFSPDGSQIAWSTNENFNIYIDEFDAHNGWFKRNYSVLEGHNKNATVGGFTPDSNYLISLSHDSTLRIWDLKTKKCLESIAIDIRRIFNKNLLFFNDKQMVINYGDRSLRLFNYQKKQMSFPIDTSRFHAQCFSHDEKYFAHTAINYRQKQREIRLCDLRTYTIQTIITSKDNEACLLLFSHDNQRLFILSDSGNSIIIYEIITKQEFKYNLPKQINIWARIEILPDDQHLIGVTSEDTLVIYDLTDFSYRIIALEEDKIHDIALNYDGSWVAVSHTPASVSWYDITTGQCIHHNQINDDINYREPEILNNPCKNQIAYSFFKDLYLDSGVGTMIHFCTRNDISSMDFNSDGTAIVVGTEGGEIIWWDIEKQKEGGILHVEDHALVKFIPNKREIAIATANEGQLRIWDLDTNEVKEYLEVNDSYIDKLIFSNSGRHLSVVGTGLFRLFDLTPLSQLVSDTRTRLLNRAFTEVEKRLYDIE